MLTVYGRATSSNVQLVMWAIGELGLPFERLDCGHNFGGLDTEAFAAMNPHRLVPVLKDGEVVLWESGAILRYLAARYGDGGTFWPREPTARARVDMWAEWAKGTLAAAFTVPIFWSRVRTSAKDRDEAALTAAIARFETLLDVFEEQVARHDYLAGPDFTAADIAAGHVFYRWFDIEIPRRPRPPFEAYMDRLRARPAYRTHVMIGYDILRAPDA
ncbi:MAG: glutathione S-transferase family protein [Pseudomonadota bacterium]